MTRHAPVATPPIWSELERRDRRTIALSIEPEPCCFLETIEETVRYSSAPSLRQRPWRGWRWPAGSERARGGARRHLGVCYDVCHAAVEFEDPRQPRRLDEAGIPVTKLQLSSALAGAEVDADRRRRCSRPSTRPSTCTR
jgi:hypothetical protein